MTDFNVIVDEQALAATLEGIPYPGEYFEVIYPTERGLSSTITLPLFPAVRTLFRSATYTIARAYIGAVETSDEQCGAISNAYDNGDLIEYERVYP